MLLIVTVGDWRWGKEEEEDGRNAGGGPGWEITHCLHKAGHSLSFSLKCGMRRRRRRRKMVVMVVVLAGR